MNLRTYSKTVVVIVQGRVKWLYLINYKFKNVRKSLSHYAVGMAQPNFFVWDF